ncbi:MAG: hypothetical protein M3R30_10340 [Candidatus Eremiobacteraeota bacterium]|nr:hypothetical protein [Candidatus Eremiobacteraeota bacterium]
MPTLVRGHVLNISAYGATVRLETGDLASAPLIDVEHHRALYERGLTGRKILSFELHEGRRPSVTLAPQITDEVLEEQITGFLRESEERQPPGDVPAEQRHYLKKKQRAARFDA